MANTYTLTEADGFPGFNYVNSFYQFPSGKIYAKDIVGNFHITGNNFVATIPALNGLENSASVVRTGENEVWFADQKKVFIIKGDSVYKTIPFPSFKHIVSTKLLGKNIYLFRQVKDSISIYTFENYEWVLKNTVYWAKKIYEIQPVIQEFGNTYLATLEEGGKLGYYLLDTTTYRFTYIQSIENSLRIVVPFFFINNFSENVTFLKSLRKYTLSRKGRVYEREKLSSIFGGPVSLYGDNVSFVCELSNNLHEFVQYDSSHILPGTIVFETKEKLNSAFKNNPSQYLTALTGNKPLRVFPLIRKYPRIYNKENSSNVFTIAQDDAGRIWAASYEKDLSIITPAPFVNPEPEKYLTGKVLQLKRQPYQFMNASLNHKGKLYFVGETLVGGILRYDMNGQMEKVNPSTPTGYYLYMAPRSRKIYLPSALAPDYPVYYCNEDEINQPFINWRKLGAKEGGAGFAKTTLTEDKLGRLWMGHPQNGFAVYDQVNKVGKTYDARLNETPIGFISCLTDKRGTVWMGSDDKGLWYYNDYSKPATPQNLKQLNHPLLNKVKRITAMCLYKDWLVLGCYEKVCLLNLDSFYLKNKTIVCYLNPQEAAFTSFTEQNTMLVSKTDSTLWFSTSDVLYQWDIDSWLKLPQYKVAVNTFLVSDSTRMKMEESGRLRLQAGTNSFDIVFEYLSPDCLPRYTRTAMVKKGDSIVYDNPALSSKFSYKNLSAGTYTFHLEVFEQDGTTSQYQYGIVIQKHLWQHWWFWVVVSMLAFLPLLLWLNALRKQALQQKRMSQLNVVSLSSQFRPHFILNALNTIGADLKDKPVSEMVISRLGESINLIFNYAQKNRITHTLADEWKLVLNVIEIHKAMYIPSLQVHLPGPETLDEAKDFQLPMGILEVLVENALLHGLRNKKAGPYILTLSIFNEGSNYFFAIKDNGIGREGAKQISSYTGHGTGTKNLNEIISILNRHNRNKIRIDYTDLADGQGTEVTVVIPLNYRYE